MGESWDFGVRAAPSPQDATKRTGRGSGRSVVVIEHAAQSPTPFDRTCLSRMGWFRADDPVGQPLVVAFGVIVGDEVMKRRPQRRFSKQDHALQTRFLD